MARGSNERFNVILFIILVAIGYWIVTSQNVPTNTQENVKVINGEYWVKAQLVTESVFENDMPWDFGPFGYQPIMRIIYEIPWDNIPKDVPYVWLNVTIPQEAINRILAIINKIKIDHNNPQWVSSALPLQVVWMKRIALGNWEMYPVRSIMVARVNAQGIPVELHVQVNRIEDRRYLTVLVYTPYTIGFEDMIGPIPQSGVFYGWTVEEADKAYIRFEKDAIYFVGSEQYSFAGGRDDNLVLFVDRQGTLKMYKDINFDLIPAKKYPVAWDMELRYGYGIGKTLGHILVMIILDGVTATGSTKYIAIPIETVDPQTGSSPNEKAELENYLGAAADYCLLPRHPQVYKMDLWEAIYNFCGADYREITKIKRIRIFVKSYGGVGVIRYIMFGHPDFLNVTATTP